MRLVHSIGGLTFPYPQSSVRLMDYQKYITIEPGKCGGRPCIRGMRMRVTDVLQLLSAGASHDEILADYPDLEEEDILAAIMSDG